MNGYIKRRQKFLRTCRKPKFVHISNWRAFRFLIIEIGSAYHQISNDLS